MAMSVVQGPDGATYEIEVSDEVTALSAFSRFSGAPQGRFDPPFTGRRTSPRGGFQEPSSSGHNVPPFDPGVPGCNPETGMVDRAASTDPMDKLGTFATSAVEGVPIAGPALLGGSKAAAIEAASLRQMTLRSQ